MSIVAYMNDINIIFPLAAYSSRENTVDGTSGVRGILPPSNPDGERSHEYFAARHDSSTHQTVIGWGKIRHTVIVFNLGYSLNVDASTRIRNGMKCMYIIYVYPAADGSSGQNSWSIGTRLLSDCTRIISAFNYCRQRAGCPTNIV